MSSIALVPGAANVGAVTVSFASHRYRGVVTDLDGTLLDPAGRVTARTARALDAARAAGMRVAAASARPLRLVEEALGEHADRFDALLVSNGASTVAVPDRAVLDEAVIAGTDAVALLERLRDQWPEAGFGWEVGSRFEHDPEFAAIARDRAIVRTLEGGAVAQPGTAVHQIVVAWPDGDPADRLDALRAACPSDLVVTHSAGGVAELSAAGADKAAAMRRWAALGGFGVADVVAFGDQTNDLTMLGAAGLGVAMGNAGAAVRAVAGAVTLGNDEDGVAVAVEAMLGRAAADLTP